MGVIKMRVVVLERREEQGAGTNGVGKKEVEVPHQLDEVSPSFLSLFSTFLHSSLHFTLSSTT